MNIQEVRQKYPQYNDLSDQQLAQSLHKKFYSDIPFEEFSSKIGLAKERPKRSTGEEVARQVGLAGRYIVEGGSALATIPANALAGVMNKALEKVGIEYRFPDQSKAISSALTDLGVPEPENATERVVGDVSRAVSGAATGIGTGQVLSSSASPAMRSAGEILTTRPGMQVASAASGGGASGVARELGRSPLEQTVAGVVGGIAVPVAGDLLVQGVKAAWKGIPAAIKPFTQEGKEEIAGNLLTKLSSDPKAVSSKLQNADEIIPGSIPTTAQAARDPGLLTAERGIASSNPVAGAKFTERFAKQNAARQSAVDDLAGDSSLRLSVENARDTATSVMREQAFANKKNVRVRPVIYEIDKMLKSPSGRQKTVSDALSYFRDQIRGEKDPEALYAIRKDINLALAGKLSGDRQDYKLASSQLIRLKESLDDVIESGAPGFKKYLSEYAERSKLINQMETAKDIALRTMNAGTTVTGENILSQAKWTNVVSKNQEELSKIFTPRQMRILTDIGKDLDRGALSSSGGKAAGSNTFQNLSTANMIGKMIGGRWPDSGLFNTITRPLAWIYKIPDQQIQELLVDAMLDPKLASKLMNKATMQNMRSISEALKERATALGLGEISQSAQQDTQ